MSHGTVGAGVSLYRLITPKQRYSASVCETARPIHSTYQYDSLDVSDQALWRVHQDEPVHMIGLHADAHV